MGPTMPTTQVFSPGPDSTSSEKESPPADTTPTEASPYGRRVLLTEPAVGDARQLLKAAAMICRPVLFGLIAPLGLVGSLLLTWLLLI